MFADRESLTRGAQLMVKVVREDSRCSARAACRRRGTRRGWAQTGRATYTAGGRLLYIYLHTIHISHGSGKKPFIWEHCFLEADDPHQGRPQGEEGRSPPPETEKIGLEKWCYFTELDKMTKVQEYRIEYRLKNQFSIEIFVCKFKNFLKNFVFIDF